ncbi:LysR family transcriptional regulator [Bordetella genomosp. 10]|uniref:LysR family transcriptional regulator n=1 Tax=Bordetella genomosp. 10 TaxID=1416804 RepID=A0A261SMN2_9BORD|nr:LysR substrate-binding domain-containing protein [Bordetella genomosp. 10]OZI38341.1 LysR family transcriptional regulator [Bordetella genomosp. 10]
MPRLPLNTLPTFRVVAELQNLRAAAEALHLTHSAVSQQLRVLETQLGHPVFDRHGRRLSLNAAGAALLPYVKEALAQLDEGMQAAAAAASSARQRLRLSVLPSFAQRWLLPRMGRWRERHPDIALEIESSQQLVDVRREGFHAALRQGRGPWPGLESEKLFDHPMPMILVGSPAAARRLAGATPADYAREPLLGEAGLWEAWFAAAGAPCKATPVAVFNDAGLLLSAVEQNLGLAVVRELLAADALRDGRLVRLSPVDILYDPANTYQLAYPPALRDWPPLATLRDWIREELEASRHALHAQALSSSR